MIDGFLRVCAAGPAVCLGRPRENARIIIKTMAECDQKKIKLAVFPELCITGYSCGDLFLQRYILDQTIEAIEAITKASADYDVLLAVGAPIEAQNKLFNCAVIIKGGEVLGVVPKTYIPNYTEFYEQRHFASSLYANTDTIAVGNRDVPFGTNLLFRCRQNHMFCVAFEVCEDLWKPDSPGNSHAAAGALIIGNLSASNEVIGKTAYRRDLVRITSAKALSAYVYSSGGEGESTTDLVFSRHKLIAENGVILAENNLYEEHKKLVYTDIDLQLLNHERRRTNTFNYPIGEQKYREVAFDCQTEVLELIRSISPTPFIPYSDAEIGVRCTEIIQLQTAALKRRIAHVNPKKLVLNISGGLDSTLALLIAHKVMISLGRSAGDIIGITSPGPGTTVRTRSNASELVKALGAELRVIPIKEDFLRHLETIGHSGEPDVAYENAQARERTQIAMDIANMEGGLFVGTPDLSEIALGFSTYGGDHISMYNINCGVPKTLIRYLIGFVADSADDNLKRILHDILDTPISPELLPPGDEGSIVQQTEKIIGDYILHDFILYYYLRYGFKKEKIFRLMKYAFDKTYTEQAMKNALDVFYRRFYASQFKRSCAPDGPKIGSVSLSPRGDWRMPSDAEYGN
ncbi:MAG TPA: NAD(+) synthase [Clostridia bacterium]|nr:NAD(+) synthase [Clostridia bacterium]